MAKTLRLHGEEQGELVFEKDPDTFRILVTPALAEEWLDCCNEHNREVMTQRVYFFMDLLKNKRFTCTHQGISFSGPKPGTGTLGDGQHRLWAIFMSGIPAWMRVTVNEPLKNQACIDQGGTRTPRQALSLSCGIKLRDAVTGGIRRMIFSMVHNTRVLDNTIFIEVFERHRDALMFASEHLRDKFLTAATVGVVARAYYTADREKLARFCEILVSGITDGSPAGKVVIRFRDEMLSPEKRSTGVMAYARCERVLVAYLKGEFIKMIYAVDKELFPLPEEMEAHLAKPLKHGGRRVAMAPHQMKTPRDMKRKIPTLAQITDVGAAASGKMLNKRIPAKPSTQKAADAL